MQYEIPISEDMIKKIENHLPNDPAKRKEFK